ncbi:MAG: 3'-5' exonuclease [Bergeyella sp.]|nr:3'-5' exonuclease [Bergeyella sp.]
MIEHIPIERVLFLDIETVAQKECWENLSPKEQALWDKKTFRQRGEDTEAKDFYLERGGIMAEFGKIICISVGKTVNNNSLRIKTFYHENEEVLLREFGEIFNKPCLKNVILCAHNGKEFDFPWISRRFLINGMRPPQPFQLYGKKPWEVPHLDTMELWKFGDYKSFVSLDLLAYILGVPSPKEDIDGSLVSSVYYKERDLEKIVKYCEKDVLTLANVFRRLRQEEFLNPLYK